MVTHLQGFSHHHSQATIIGGSNLTKAAQGEETIIKDKIVLVLTKRDIPTILREQSIIPALADAQLVLSASQDHSWVCHRDTSVRLGEATTQTPKAEAYIGPGIRVRERANRDMRDPGLQNRALVELLKEIMLSQVGMRNLYLVLEVIREVGVGLPA